MYTILDNYNVERDGDEMLYSLDCGWFVCTVGCCFFLIFIWRKNKHHILLLFLFSFCQEQEGGILSRIKRAVSFIQMPGEGHIK